MANISLREYQAEALKRMHNGCILNGGVGSGKSRTSLAYYYRKCGGLVTYYKQDADGQYTIGPYSIETDKLISREKSVRMIAPPDLYIITIAKKRDSLEWEDELVPFQMSPDPKLNGYSNKIVIDSWNNIKKYIDVKDAFFIFDEQKVVGYGSWVKSFLTISANNQWVLLSATPGDKWIDYMPVFIANGYFRNKTDFTKKHVVWDPHVSFPKVKNYLDEGTLLKMKRSLLIQMDFHRTTIQHHIHIICDYNKENMRYTTGITVPNEEGKMCKIRVNPFTGEIIENASQYCYIQRKIVNGDPDRVKQLLGILEEHPKAIIFYNFDYELDILRETFEKYPHAEWNGHLHQEVPVGDHWVYLVQYTSGSEAWNCITTDTIVFYSQNYSYRMMEQASGRIDRLNTPYTDLYYFHLRSNSKIDDSIRVALRNKKKFNENTYAKKMFA